MHHRIEMQKGDTIDIITPLPYGFHVDHDKVLDVNCTSMSIECEEFGIDEHGEPFLKPA